ncbi:hypothetical protein DP939_25525 [Spongiactinospora rosea]|uniref:Clp R domain-containing protein n=1 Tax=Spongiactinospora rosea TaxID=2248750 RepID=A0A366LVR5_9ACTN|nr:Clp protease N-terminal domain-containing protein [Spongiactinospora rosea]RBQ17414.1 hypothetical protein DP939_25525 [Spongiactinospora rosea]
MLGRSNSPFAVVVDAAREEARRRGDRRLSTEHLLLGLLHEPGAARAFGVDLATARAGLDDLDRAALRALGIEVGDLGELLDHPPAPPRHPRLRPASITSAALDALRQAVKATTVRTRRTAPGHLLLALLSCEPPDPAAALIGRLGVDRAAVRERLA